MDKVVQYFNGDAIAADSWRDKYQMKNKEGEAVEETPADMHMRMAREFARVEYSYAEQERKAGYLQLANLSEFGQRLSETRLQQTQADIIHEIFDYFDKFSQIVPQGSLMSNLGNFFVFGSLSNCFGIAPPFDSYGGIMKTDQELVQLMKRRGGVGTGLDTLRPETAYVSNAARSSSGVVSFAERYSNSTREVAQEGRRGALMLLLSVKHPSIFRFITMKADRTKVTGANVSVKFTDEFMRSVEKDEDFYCTFPIDVKLDINDAAQYQFDYNILSTVNHTDYSSPIYIMRIRAKELFEEFVNMAWDNAEPGAAYIDRIQEYCPDGVYEIFMPTVCNPCAEQWFSHDETCRLIATNFFCFIDNPFTKDASVNLKKVYEVSYMQQRLGDDLVDLEVQYIERIIDKLEKDPEPEEIKAVEINLWKRIKDKALAGRRTGNGFTALADMLAAVNCIYKDCPETLECIESVLKIKMEAELDATIDMAITRGTFIGWDTNKEFEYTQPDQKNGAIHIQSHLVGTNSFFQMLLDEFPAQALRMQKFGRRNVSWSTVAPTGTVSLMCQTTSGLEPLYKAFYIRRKKINSEQANVKIDFEDQNGDKWQNYSVLHPKFREWIKVYMLINNQVAIGDELVTLERRDFNEPLLDELIDYLDKDSLQKLFELSPWYGYEADNIDWETRININALIQKYTTNSLSCTINLPADVSKETVHNIYMEGWRKGLKGITIYRDGSRSGVLLSDTKLTNCDEFGYTDAIKRPDVLEADYYHVTVQGRKFAVFVGKLNNNPYELFAFEDPIKHEDVKGQIIKVSKGVYKFESTHYNVDNLQLNSDHTDERLLTRWVSLLLRHGANPKFIVEQIEKSEVTVVSFAKAISRVLKSYIADSAVGEECPNCHQHTVIYQEGCKRCTSCGHSKC